MTIFAIRSYNDAQHQKEINKRLEQSNSQSRNALQGASEALRRTQKEKMDIESSLKQKAQEDAEKAREIESLRSQLSAKQASKAKLAYSPVSGNCASWIASAGIQDITNAQELIRRESGCDPTAVNPSSGACGIAQELPCGKSGCSLGDGACQIKWMASYVANRYGSFVGAIAHHNAKGWY